MDSERFETALRARGWRQKRLAALMGVDAAAVSRWKNGTQKLKIEELVRIASHLGVSAGWLLGVPGPGVVLTDRERDVLRLVRSMGIDEAIDRLGRSAAITERGEHTGGIDPATGAPVPPKPKKRKGAG